MGFKCGIVGLPNAGKSTLFNALTRAGVAAANYPFCTIEPNVGIVPVPDRRLDALAHIVKPDQIVPASMQFVDIAGLVKGAAQGEGLGNQFLAHIRETQAIAHVVRCYENEDILHVSGRVDPLSDMDIINTELALADLETAERAFDKTNKLLKTGDKQARQKALLLEKVIAQLNQGLPVRRLTLEDAERDLLGSLHLLTAKPMLYVANVCEGGFENNPHLEQFYQFALSEKSPSLAVCVLLESEVADLPLQEKKEFLHALGAQASGLDRFIQAGYDVLGLQTYFTAGQKEVRAWTIPKGMTAPQAAGVIHSDFERAFIRAEVVAFDDYVRYQGVQGAKEAGVWRLEGKDYMVCDGDVVLFRAGL